MNARALPGEVAGFFDATPTIVMGAAAFGSKTLTLCRWAAEAFWGP